MLFRFFTNNINNNFLMLEIIYTNKTLKFIKMIIFYWPRAMNNRSNSQRSLAFLFWRFSCLNVVSFFILNLWGPFYVHILNLWINEFWISLWNVSRKQMHNCYFFIIILTANMFIFCNRLSASNRKRFWKISHKNYLKNNKIGENCNAVFWQIAFGSTFWWCKN